MHVDFAALMFYCNPVAETHSCLVLCRGTVAADAVKKAPLSPFQRPNVEQGSSGSKMNIYTAHVCTDVLNIILDPTESYCKTKYDSKVSFPFPF